ncbi:unnamed protein product [Linum tenue]|uniref:Uncharacterized protein n=1 Tax=Linum tenue TaxID=586396 RepID=A0AAV0NUJ3_9ROSI|nr:unnamed protein product [Linum tenue]
MRAGSRRLTNRVGSNPTGSRAARPRSGWRSNWTKRGTRGFGRTAIRRLQKGLSRVWSGCSTARRRKKWRRWRRRIWK